MIPRRVVITGMGVATALGFDVDTLWRRLLAGDCGIERLPNFEDDSVLPTRIAGRIHDDALEATLERRGVSDPDRPNQLALCVVGAALEDAGLPTDGRKALEHDILFGTGHGNAWFQNQAIHAFFSEGYRKLRPTTVVRLMFNRPANLASIRYRLTGAAYVLSAACATGAVALSEAFHRVRFGLADEAVAACADTGLELACFSAWNRLGVLSRNPDPARACRPFDRDRDGLVIGEGGAAFVVETLEKARARGARIHAEILGAGLSSDATHIVQPDSAGQVVAIRKALAQAGTPPSQIDYINAHGTATPLADKVEAATLQEVFGTEIERVLVSNTKAQLGHLMGATAGVELAVTVRALQEGLLPASCNLDHPDPECALRFVRGKPMRQDIAVALKNSFAFGGSNCAVVLRRWDG